MTQFLKPPGFQKFAQSAISTNSSTGQGVTFSCGVDTKGTTVNLISALPFEGEYIVFLASGFYSSGADVSAICDIMIDPAGGTSWSVFISNLLCGQSAFAAGTQYRFPIKVPRGSSLGVRGQLANSINPTEIANLFVF